MWLSLNLSVMYPLREVEVVLLKLIGGIDY